MNATFLEAVKAILPWIGGLIGVTFGILAWIARREIRERQTQFTALEQQLRDLQSQIAESQSNLTRLMETVSSLSKDVIGEEENRKEVNRQLWAKVNGVIKDLAALDTTVSSHQTGCQRKYMSQDQYDRLEAARSRSERLVEQQNQRLETALQDVQRALMSAARRNGKT